MSTLRQTNFAAGELDSLLWGRTDLSLYSKGCRQLRNFFLSHAGAAVSRPGTTFIAQCNTHGDGSILATPPRVIPFVFSDDEAYVCEFGAGVSNGYIRIYLKGVLRAEIVQTGIAEADLPKLKWAQIGNLLTVCIPNTFFTSAMELRRITETVWTWEATKLTPPDPQLPDVGASAMANPFNPGSAPQVLITTPFMLLEPLPVGDTDHTAREWIWGFTAIMQRLSDGLQVESVFTLVTQSTDGVERLVAGDPLVRHNLVTHKIALAPDKPVTLVRLGESLGPTTGYRTLSFRIYRGRGDVFGWVGDTRGREFVDVGEEPNYADQPPLGTNPFTFRLHPNGLQPVRTPMTVGFFEQRRAFGGALGDDIQVPSQPGHLFLSASGDYYNFDVRLSVHVDSEALVHEMASQRWEEIRHLVTLDRLLVLTSSSAWSLAGQQGQPLTFQPPDLEVIDAVGATHVPPIIVDQSALYVRNKGTGARALVPSPNKKGGYEGADITQVAHHLFVGHDRDIVDWCFAEDPWGVVWAVRADGLLLSLTYTRGGWGWARHDTDGLYEACCSVPEGDEDAVYVVVKRVINGIEKRYLERMTSRHSRAPSIGADEGAAVLSDDGLTVLTPPDYICVDSAKQYLAGEQPGAIDGLEHLEGEQVWVVGQRMMPLGPFPVVDGAIDLVDVEGQLPSNVSCLAGPKLLVHVGMLYTPELETLDVAEARLGTKIVERVGVEVDQSVGLEAGQDFDHLAEWEARTVEDGYDPITPQTTLIDTAVEGTWGQTGRAVLRQTLPLPVTVVAITREVVKGD